MFFRNLLLSLLVFFSLTNQCLASFLFKNLSSVNGLSFDNFSSVNRDGVIKRGSYLVFSPYTGITIKNNNKLTFIKPQSPVKIIAKLKNQPFYFCEHEKLNGFVKEEDFSFIDDKSLEFFLSLDTLYLKKPLFIGDVLFPTATEVRYVNRKKFFYEVYIWEDGFKRAYINKKYLTDKIKPTKVNYKKITGFFNGSPYFWAGSERGWDCSLLVKDFYKIFDIEMPRNSFQQISCVENIDVSNLSLKEKIKILKKSEPFETLLYFPGHIMIFSGFKGKEPMSFQAINRFNNKFYGKVGHFPLKKTGLLNKVTKIGYIPLKGQGNLTISRVEGKIQSIVKD
ncbi:MAG: C40 family peptidase [Proteobacteria bacterium]|nr:C40 family peptidase [Pseudomonadota bacterium]